MLRDVPEGWHSGSFGEFITLQRGFDLPVQDRQKGVVAVIASNGKIDYHLEKRTSGPAVVTGRSGTLGKVFFLKDGCWPLNTTLYVKDFHGNDPKFVAWFLNNFKLERFGTGTGVPTLNRNVVHQEDVVFPPLAEQRRIAEILSSVDEAIAATQAVIEQTKKIKLATLERLLTKGIGHRHFKQTEVGDIPDSWDVATIESYLARLIDYRGVPPPKAETGIPLITAKNVRMGYLNPEPREYIREADFNDWMRRGIPEAGDVLFTTEAPLGYVAQVPNYQIALGQRTITLCPDRKRLNPSFLTWLLLSSASQLRIMERATGSTALGIKQATFRKILFPFPPLDEQRKIAFYMDEIAKTEELENRKLTGLIAIKSALMSDLLTGRKRVTDTLPLAAQ